MNDGNLALRTATVDDLDSLIELWWESGYYHQNLDSRFRYASDAENATREYMSNQIQSEDACFWVTQINDDIIGYIEAMVTERPPIHVNRRIGYIESLYVKPEYRRKGIGTDLWKLAYDWLKEKGIQIINLWVAFQNPIALEFWKKLDFREIMIRLEFDSS